MVLTTTPDAVYAKYGMAYDNNSPDGPWLWVFEQNLYNLRQFDPVALVYTGVSCTVNSGIPSSVAGGCCFDGVDTAYCKVVDVWTDAEYYLPGDVIELTVMWRFVFIGEGLPGWSVPEDFLVGGGLGKEPNGNPRFIQNTMVYDVEPGTYEEMFYFTVPM
ncbi:hypothetical protein AMJ39_06820, partial [candidate division TA06 bacterium DG_24]